MVAAGDRNVTYPRSMHGDLTDVQIGELRAALEALERELSRTVEQSRDGARVVSLDEPIGRLSRMDAIQQQKMAEASRRQHELRVSQVKVALAAMHTGEYGVCRRCEEPIGLPRLRARPETILCVDCQGSRERG